MSLHTAKAHTRRLLSTGSHASKEPDQASVSLSKGIPVTVVLLCASGPSTVVKKQPTQQGDDWFRVPQRSKPRAEEAILMSRAYESLRFKAYEASATATTWP